MPDDPNQLCLDANLACLGKLNADVAEAIRYAQPADDIEFTASRDGASAARFNGRALCSLHQPLAEANRQTERIDITEHAVVVSLGFGLGHHIARLAERMARSGVIIVFEPDLSLLRSVFERLDMTDWMSRSLMVWMTDPRDGASLANKLRNCEAIIAQGVHIHEHPPSRRRLDQQAATFTSLIRDHVSATRTTLTTTLVRSVDTVRNLINNLDHYTAGAGVAELAGIAEGHLGIVVSAGPSLHRNIDLLATKGVRDRAVIIATQTTLRPLLAAGVTPHFVTTLDYHEISRRFYEELDPERMRQVTLICDPKANPVILDAYPGPIRSCQSGFLDLLLGQARRNMGKLPAGATVAHLAYYLARHLGCDPVALIGQDLGFTDGLYYAPGTAIDEVWAPELNPFNTLEMMQWKRIARHKLLLQKIPDGHGRMIYTDRQMAAYLHQFERDFAGDIEKGLTIIDATEGGAAKQHTTVLTLEQALDRYADRSLVSLPLPNRELDQKRLNLTQQRILDVRRDVRAVRDASHASAKIIRRMLDDQTDGEKMNQHFKQINKQREIVRQRKETFQLLDQLNQLAAYKRFRADRQLHMHVDAEPLARQRAELNRDLVNVTWSADAAEELLDQLGDADRMLRGESNEIVIKKQKPPVPDFDENAVKVLSETARIAALIPVDPQRNGLGIRRSLSQTLCGRNVLQHTLNRLGRSQRLQSIILIVPEDFDIDSLINTDEIGLPVEIERCEGSPLGPRHEAIAAARLWAGSCWRGGIGGMTIYDELLCPAIMSEIMTRRQLTAALLVGPDWPVVDISETTGCDAVIARHLTHPDKLNLVFTQAPPGMCGCLISTSQMNELASETRLSTVGTLLDYQPRTPQHDPIARDLNVQIDHRIRQSLVRATFDSSRNRAIMREAFPGDSDSIDSLSAADVIARLEAAELSVADHPTHIVIDGFDSDVDVFGDIDVTDETVISFAGASDPLRHPQFDSFIKAARDAGVRGIHVRTELLTDQETIDRLVGGGVDVVSVNLHANSSETYKQITGRDDFDEVLNNIEYLCGHRRRLSEHPPNVGLSLPWVVPRMKRCAATLEEIEPFFDRWQHILGAAAIDGDENDLELIKLTRPTRVVQREKRRTMTKPRAEMQKAETRKSTPPKTAVLAAR